MGFERSIGDAVRWEVPVVDLQSSLLEVVRQQVANDVSALIVKNDGVVVGMITDMDVLYGIVDEKYLDTTKVSEYLTSCGMITGQSIKSPCAQIDESESVKNALKVLGAAGTHHLLVSGDKGEAGIVSIRDLLKLLLSPD